jgi:prepilin-type N-terminal cleavage/methylation domain-containing protein
MKNSTKGFTLVELSIVLVIIGLLIGGILVAESLIGTTKMQSFISQMQQYDVATNTFYDKFGGLPGDTSKMAGANPGNGDAYVTGAAGVFNAVANTSEIGNFWPHLSMTGLSKQGGGNYSNNWTTNGAALETTVPKAKLGNLAIIAVGSAALGGNHYYIADCSGTDSDDTIACEDGISDADGIAIDSKIDDGLGTSGDVRGFDGSVTTLAALDAGSASNFDLSSESNESSMTIRIGSHVGDRK